MFSKLSSFLFLGTLVAASSSFVSAQPATGTSECTPNSSFGDLQNIIISADSAGTSQFTLDPSFHPKIFSYTATIDTSHTSVYLTINTLESMQQLFTRYDQGDWDSVDSGTSQQLTLTGGGVSDFAYIFVDCDCHQQYNVTLKPPTVKIIVDPQFTGLKGQSYQIHGIPNEYYNLITDSYIQYSSQFVFLTEGKCPIINGEVQKGDCWTHPGTYLGEVGLKTSGGDRVHVVAGDRESGFQAVTLNGKTLSIGEVMPISFHPSTGAALPYPSFVNYTSTHSFTISGAGFFTITLTNSDWFLNQKVDVLNWAAINSHGLLGQTWHAPVRRGQVKDIEGFVDDYLILDHQLWGDNFLYNQFGLTENIGQQKRIITTSSMKTKKTQ